MPPVAPGEGQEMLPLPPGVEQDMPPVAEANHNAPATTNPLGVKGVGESGTTGSIAAIMNAIANAIPDGRGNTIDMPATPEKVWRACREMTG